MKKPLKRIAITGGAGQIAYNLLFRIASGELLGKDQPIALHILEVPSVLKALEGIKMELEDGAYPLLEEIHIGSDPFKLFEGANLALLIGAKPRGPGMERKDLLSENGRIFVEQGKALHQVADLTARIFVVGNPCNTNCLIAMHQGNRIPRENFYAMTRLDQNRTVFQLSSKAGVKIEDISHVTIWGNHSSTQVPDFVHGKIKDKPLQEVIRDTQWLENDFMTIIQKRGAAIIEARGKSSAASAAQALIDCIKDVINPTAVDYWYSLGLISNQNPYGIRDDLIFSFPCKNEGNKKCEIVPNLEMNEFLQKNLRKTEQELIEERDLVKHLLRS